MSRSRRCSDILLEELCRKQRLANAENVRQAATYLDEEFSRVLGVPFLRLVVNVSAAESRRVSVRPKIVDDQCPIYVAWTEMKLTTRSYPTDLGANESGPVSFMGEEYRHTPTKVSSDITAVL